MKFCGIDLHSNNSVVVVTDETDRVLLSRRCPNELTKILPLLEPHRAELLGVVVESTYNWYWLVDGLKAAGFEVKLATPVAMQRYDGLKHSDDKDDAAFLAHLLRLGILPTGYIHPPQERALRDLARKRIQLVRSRTQHILAVENIMARPFSFTPQPAPATVYQSHPSNHNHPATEWPAVWKSQKAPPCRNQSRHERRCSPAPG
jgi:transposase